MTCGRIKGAVNAKAIFQVLVVESEDHHAEHIPNPVVGWERYFCKGLGLPSAKEHEGAGCPSGCVDREI